MQPRAAGSAFYDPASNNLSSPPGNEPQSAAAGYQPAADQVSGDDLNFVFNGFLLSRKDILRMINNIPSPILAAGTGLFDPNVVHLFDSQDAFDQWSLTTRFADRFVRINEIIHRARRFVSPTPWQTTVRLIANTPIDARAMAAVGDGSRTANVSRIHAGILPDLETSETDEESGGLALLYEELNFGGRCFTLGPAAISDLSDIDLFKQVKSVRCSGVCLLTDQVTFGGARLYLVGDPTLHIADLREWGFTNGAASAINL